VEEEKKSFEFHSRSNKKKWRGKMLKEGLNIFSQGSRYSMSQGGPRYERYKNFPESESDLILAITL